MKHFIFSTLILLSYAVSAQDNQKIYALGNLTNTKADSFTYAVIGDYGDDSPGELHTAEMVKSWNPLFVITTGDNDYEDKNGKSIDSNITQYYAAYINSDLHKNRFFPCLGNHDQKETEKAKILDEYFRVFSCLNRAENFDFTYGPIHFYSINSGPDSKVAVMQPAIMDALKDKLSNDPELFHITFFHHPAFSSAYGISGPQDWLNGLKTDVILNGHIHYYERITDVVRHVEHITIGCSGRDNDKCGTELANNKDFICSTCRDKQNGAIKVTVTKVKKADQKEHWSMKFDYYDVRDTSKPADTWTITK